jgi:ferritin-like metal-binding protein YciE
MGSYRGLVTAAQQMGQDQIVDLLQQNLQEEEQTAQTAEQSAPQLLQKVM